jgi:hypothetical protein
MSWLSAGGTTGGCSRPDCSSAPSPGQLSYLPARRAEAANPVEVLKPE